MQTMISAKHLKTLANLILAIVAGLLFAGCASKVEHYSRSAGRSDSSEPTQRPYVINNITYYPIADARGFREKGIASWYGPGFNGRSTSNGERYDMYAMTAAHKILPMNTMLLVKNLENGREVVVRVNDRGPFVRGRVIDLSLQAAQELKIDGPGTSQVQIVALTDDSQLARAQQSSARQAARMASTPPAKKPRAARTSGGRSRQPQLSRSEYYVQIGAFDRKERAVHLQKRFTNAGHQTVIQTSNNPKQPYLVHVYAGRELVAAKKAEAALLERGYTGAFIVSR